MVDDLCRAGPDFERMWRDNQVLGHGDGENVKRPLHPTFGLVEMECLRQACTVTVRASHTQRSALALL
ncbi:hypothetical protein [Paraburkholderia antibiotica]|uniref:hypothetical protein n=1 Tax=Paraburkholderia antibiotica TaxID=2728839 RepID=UPI002E2EAF0B|nr:hypothetical protein [Paraburkholderia antibiotica]